MEVPMRPKNTLGLSTAGTALFVAASFLQTSLTAAKPAPPSTNPSCTITIDDTLAYTDPGILQVHTIPTMVQSDGQGAYVDGVDGVQCYVNQGVNSGNYQNLFVNVASNSRRYLWMPGQVAVTPYTRTAYTDFANRQPGYFDITGIDTVKTLGLTERRRIRVGVGYELDFNGGLMFGDSLSSDPLIAGSSSAWITPLTLNGAGTSACSWRIQFYPYAAAEAGDTGAIAGTRYGALQEGTSNRRKRTADFAMPISATVRIRTGVNGCS